MVGPNWKLEDNYETVTVTFPTSPAAGLKLDAENVLDMLKNLGEFRAHMLPPIPESFALGQRVDVVPGPAWATEPDAFLGNSLIHLRDPRYGWLHYMLPRDEARKLGEYLITQANMPEPGPASGKPN